MMEDLFRERQRKAIRDLVELTAHRGSAEKSIVQAYESGISSNQSEFENRRDEILRQFDADTVDTTNTYDREKDRIEKEIAAKQRRADMEYACECERIRDKARGNLQEGEKHRQEAIWATETVYEAKKDQPDLEFRNTCELLRTQMESIDWLTTTSESILRRIHLRLPVNVPENPAEPKSGDPADSDDIDALKDLLAESLSQAEKIVDALGGLFAAQFVKGWRPLGITALLSGLAAAYGAFKSGWTLTTHAGMFAGGGAFLSIVMLAGFYVLARRHALPMYQLLRDLSHEANALKDHCTELATKRRDQTKRELVEVRDRDVAQANETYEPIHRELTQRRDLRLSQIDEAYEKRLGILATRQEDYLKALEKQFSQNTEKIVNRRDVDLGEVTQKHDRRREELQGTYESDWGALEVKWTEGMSVVFDIVGQLIEGNDRYFPKWDHESWNEWNPPLELAPAIRFGGLHIDRAKLSGGLAQDERLHVDGPEQFTLPASLVFPKDCSLLIQYEEAGRDEAVRILQNVMLRLLTCLPPGKVRFTILDPVGLGQSFAGFMHLADFDELLVTSRIWTETRHIEQRLADLTEHIENVIQKYLRNEFETIAQYNEKAGEIAEPYRFLVISDLPAGFSETAVRRLASIANSGARCGLYFLIGMDIRQKLPLGLDLADLRKNCHGLRYSDGRYVWEDEDYGSFPLTCDEPPGDEFITRILQEVGRGAKDSSRVEVPFEVITPGEGEYWSLSTVNEIKVPLGRAGATKLQSLVLGHGTSQHALIAGKTGSGKSTLLHALITNLSLWCSPDEIEFYLVDFKKGVEFKAYATRQLPHARVIAIESDREFGLSVLQRVDLELKQRGKLFRELEVQDIAGFRAIRPKEHMPRVLLIIDEFQEFFIEDDKVAQDAALLLDRLVRQGRAFGIHILLGSQTLGGAYSLARSTLGQMAVRIALQCSEADSYLIMSDDNSAARLLSRPGEAIYNDASGMVEGNNLFQIAWLSDIQRESYLQKIAGLAKERNFRPPDRQVIFEGNVPADVEQNHLLNALLEREDWPDTPKAVHAWLGDAIAIKDPTSAVFRRQSGSNLVIVGQRDESAMAILAMSLIGLAAQHAPGTVKFYLFDGTPADSPGAGYFEHLSSMLPHEITCVGWRGAEDVLIELNAECERRQQEDDTTAPAIYIMINSLQRYRMLRQVEDFSFSMDSEKPASPDKIFASILREGPNFGIHTLLWCDTLTNLERVVDRASMREFDNRVLFQMSSSDSTNLIDTPAASKMGIRRAILHNEEHGQLEKFRPYAVPDEAWLEKVRDRLAKRQATESSKPGNA